MVIDTLTLLAEGFAIVHPEIVTGYEFDHGELILDIARDQINVALAWLRDHPDYKFVQLVDICGVDNPSMPERFTIVYNMLSLKKNLRIRLKVTTDEVTPVPSCVALFPVAGWYEREVYDLYGVSFAGNPDMRRILTDYGFEGFPLRKDFPLTGYQELRYDPLEQRCVYEPVKLTQDFRRFEFMSPWEGMTNVQLPGDEKAVKPLGTIN